MQRRDFVSGVAAAAAGRLEEEEYDIVNVDEWDPIGFDRYCTGEVSPEQMSGSAAGTYGGMGFDPDDFTAQRAVVLYSASGVSLDLEAHGEGDVRTGLMTEFTSDQARELAAMLYQAAEELDRRREAGDGQ